MVFAAQQFLGQRKKDELFLRSQTALNLLECKLNDREFYFF